MAGVLRSGRRLLKRMKTALMKSFEKEAASLGRARSMAAAM
jgi:hypothetical protein